MSSELIFLSIFFPYLTLWTLRGDFYWDFWREYPYLAASLLFYLASSVAAAIVARRLEFHRYRLRFVRNAHSAFWGCLFLWAFTVPYLLHNRRLVLDGKAQLEDVPRPPDSELFQTACIWNMIWFMLMGILIPSMVQNPRRANESTAVTLLRAYDRSQRLFKLRGWAAVPGNNRRATGYCDNFRNLFYGRDERGEPLRLVSKGMADAFAAPSGGAAVADEAEGASAAFAGYVFLEDPFIAGNELWESKYGLVGYPVISGRTGTRMFWIDDAGDILASPCTEGAFRLLTPERSPLHPEGRHLWEAP